MGHGQSATVDRSVPVIAKIDECVVLHSQEPWAMLACGTQCAILGEVEVGVIIQLHLKCRDKNVTNPIIKRSKSKYRNLYKANSSKLKAKMELFSKEFVPELNTKILGNSSSFLTITHMTLSAKQFRKYRILMINVAAIFYFWTEQRQNGSSISRLELAETPEVPNTISESNSLNFLMGQ
jgi:hypothetical protein